MTARPTVIVLAAGKGERFRAAGGLTHKLDALIEGKTVLEHTLAAVAHTGFAFHVVRPAPELQSMGDSIASGVEACADAVGWLLLPADLPAIRPETISAVADAISRGAEAARPVCGGRMGHPVGFSAQKRFALLNCKGFGGAVQVFAASDAMKIEVDDLGCVSDVDTPVALAEVAGWIGAGAKRGGA